MRGVGLRKKKPRRDAPAGVLEIGSISHGQGASGLPAQGRLAHVMMMVVRDHWIEGRFDEDRPDAAQGFFCSGLAAPAQLDVS